MSTYLRRLLVAVLAVTVLGVTACDNGTDTVATATVEILAYIDANNSNSNDAGDVPIEGATVTLTMAGSDATPLTQTTGTDGIASFDGVEIGSYTASIEAPASLSGVTLASASSPAVAVEEDGVTVSASFRYTYNPGAIMGHVFLGSGSYADGDPVVAGVPVTVSQGGTEITSAETDASGVFFTGGLLPGDYDVAVETPAYLTAGTSSQTVTLAADDTASADFAMSVGTTSSVADARAASEGDTLTVVGIALSGTAGDSAVFSTSSFYMQDASGISIYLADVSLDVMLGDSVLIYGVRGSFSQEVQLSTLAAIVLGEGTLPTPTDLTMADLNGGESQGQLVTIQDAMVDSMDGGNVWVSELTTGEHGLYYLDSTTGLDTTNFATGSIFDVTGVAARYNDTFELKPRVPSDIVEETSPAMTIADALAETSGTVVTVTGVVSSGTENPGSLSTSSWWMQDATAGVAVYMSGAPSTLTIGDVVEVTGTIGSYQDHPQITATSATETRTAAAPVARPITAAEFNAGDYQGELGVVGEATVDSVSGSNIFVSDTAGGSILVYLDSDSGVSAGTFMVDSTYGITGVITSYYGPKYELIPRMPEDIAGAAVAPDTVTTVAEARAAADGTPVKLTGVVTVANDTLDAIDSRNAYMQDGTAGILVRMPSADSMVAVGDSIMVTGTTGAYAMELQVNVDGLTRLGTGTTPTARTVTPGDIEAGSYQGELAVMDSVEVTAVSGGSITVTDGTDTTTVYVDSDTDIEAMGAVPVVGNFYNITGVVSRYNTTYELKPRSAADIVDVTP